MAKKNSKKAKPDVSKKAAPKPNLTVASPRVVRSSKYESFRLQKHLKSTAPRPEVAGGFRLLFRSIKVLCTDWQLFGSIIVIYLILELILVQGLSLVTSGSTFSSTKNLLSGASNLASTSASLFLLLVGNGTGNSSSSAYQFILLLFISLVLIWAFRQHYLGTATRIRDAFYQGMAPFVPFFLVLLTVGLELVPATIGVILYTAVTSNGIASTGVEHILWAIIMIILIIVSCYFIAGSIFALYIVTLRDMQPVQALKMANKLVRGRRLRIMTKLIFIPIAVFIIMAIVMVPFLLFAVKIAPVAFFIVTALMVAVLHGYLYGLYRELLNEQAE
jgi:hypothetical protein